MTDYRLKALQKVFEKPSSTVDLKEAGGAIPGFLDDDALEKQLEHLDLLEVLFQHMIADELDRDETKATLLALTMVFTEETEELSTLCDRVGGLDDVKASWIQQNAQICGALNQALTFYERRDAALLSESLENIRLALEQRKPLYVRMSSAAVHLKNQGHEVSRDDLDDHDEDDYEEDDYEDDDYEDEDEE